MFTYFNILSQIMDLILSFMTSCELFIIAFIAISLTALFRFISVSYFFK